MGAPVPFRGFVGSAFSNANKAVDLQDLCNWYLEVAESPNARTPTGLQPCPGFRTKLVLPKTPVRADFAQNDRCFAIANDALYEIFRDWTYVQRSMTVLADPVTPIITNSPLDPPLDVPNVPSVAVGGAVGTTTYGYRVTAFNVHGETTPSVMGTTTNGNAVLSATSYNLVQWDLVAGATGYKVYRTVGATTTLIGVMAANATQLLDIGTAGTVQSPPSSNTSGGVAGTTTYGYKIVARLGLGHTAPSAEGRTNTGQATLDEDNYNILTWPAVTNAHSYDVYRTTGGTAPPVLLTNTSKLTYNDVGEDGDAATLPASNNTATFTLVNDGTPAKIYSSGDAGSQILIISGGTAYVFDLDANTLAPVVSGATSGGYISGYFVVLDASTSTLKSSELVDGYAWDETQVYQRLSAGDRWLAVGVTSNNLYLIGSNSTDVYSVTGDNDTRFAPFNSITIEYGIIAPASLDVSPNGVLTWMSQNQQGAGPVVSVQGYQASVISTLGFAREVEQFSTLADAYAVSYQQEGHAFYILTFPSDDRTWAFDRTTGEWHRRASYNPNNMRETAYRMACHCFAFSGVGFGTHLVGDSQSGVLAEMSTDYGTDLGGGVIRRVRQTPYMTSGNQTLITVWNLLFDLLAGNGIATGQGSDPTIALQISKDRGNTWGKVLTRPTGAQGAYKTRVAFGRLGDARDWVFRFYVTDPVPWRIQGAFIEVSGGTA